MTLGPEVVVFMFYFYFVILFCVLRFMLCPLCSVFRILQPCVMLYVLSFLYFSRNCFFQSKKESVVEISARVSSTSGKG